MLAYSKKAKMREARKETLTEMAACAEHFDLVVLMTLHDDPRLRFGANRLRRFYWDFARKYEEYKRRYLATYDSTTCGNRLDTQMLKQQLKDIGFDYDAECEAIREEMEQERNKERG